MHEEATRHCATLRVEEEVRTCSQHFKGGWNVVADSLSRDARIPDDALTSILHLACPEQMPANFHMHLLPQEIEW